MKEEPIILNPPKKRQVNHNLNLLIFVLVFLGLIIAIPYYLFVPKKEAFKLQQYETAKVGIRDFVVTVAGTGKVVAGEKSVVIAPTDGSVVKIWCKTGDVLKVGDVIAELDSRVLKEDLKKAEIQYNRKVQEKATLELENKQRLKELDEQITEALEAEAKLQKDFPTWEKLYELGDISRSRIEEEQKKLIDAGKALAQTKAQRAYILEKYRLNMAEVEAAITENAETKKELNEKLKSVFIKADIAGKLVNIPIKVGENLKMGNTLAEIVNEESYFVQGQVNLNYIEQVKIGQIVHVNIGGQNYAGNVIFIAEIAKERSVQVDVEFIESPRGLRPDAEAVFDIEVNVRKDCLCLPRGRYLSSGQERYVYLIDGEKAYKTKVSFGLIDGNYIEVRSGVEVGDQVITSAYDNFIHLDEIKLNPKGGVKL